MVRLVIRRSLSAGNGQKHIQQPFFGVFPGLGLDDFLLNNLFLVDRQFQQILEDLTWLRDNPPSGEVSSSRSLTMDSTSRPT